jgi:hypothetical protein
MFPLSLLPLSNASAVYFSYMKYSASAGGSDNGEKKPSGAENAANVIEPTAIAEATAMI